MCLLYSHYTGHVVNSFAMSYEEKMHFNDMLETGRENFLLMNIPDLGSFAASLN
jgi:hypothetical protein